jgi:hypothetical protein
MTTALSGASYRVLSLCYFGPKQYVGAPDWTSILLERERRKRMGGKEGSRERERKGERREKGGDHVSTFLALAIRRKLKVKQRGKQKRGRKRGKERQRTKRGSGILGTHFWQNVTACRIQKP